MYTDVVNRLDKARNFKELEVVEEYVRKACMLYDMWFNEMRDRYMGKGRRRICKMDNK